MDRNISLSIYVHYFLSFAFMSIVQLNHPTSKQPRKIKWLTRNAVWWSNLELQHNYLGKRNHVHRPSSPKLYLDRKFLTAKEFQNL